MRQETRHWNEDEGRTGTLRTKEEAEDYRYFPEPDLVPLDPGDEWIARVDAELPVLPAERRAALADAAGVAPNVAAVAIAVERRLDGLALAAIAAGGEPARVLTHVEHNLAVEGAEALDPAKLAALVSMETAGELTATQAKDVLAEMVASGDDPAAIAKAKGYEAMGADELAAVVDGVVAANPDQWARFVEDGEGRTHRLLRRRGHEGHQAPGGRQGRDGPAATGVRRSWGNRTAMSSRGDGERNPWIASGVGTVRYCLDDAGAGTRICRS